MKKIIESFRWWQWSFGMSVSIVGVQAWPVFAQLQPVEVVSSVDDIWTKILCNVVFWMFTFALVFSIITVLLAAYKFLTSSGNETTITEARNMLFYAAIGIVIALIANSTPSIVSTFIGGNALVGIC